jgi:hypothetical protein
MLQTTIHLVGVILNTDPTIDAQERTRILQLLQPGSASSDPPPLELHLITRQEVARRLNRTVRTVDSLPLKKVRLPGRKTAAGFLESDVDAFIKQACVSSL